MLLSTLKSDSTVAGISLTLPLLLSPAILQNLTEARSSLEELWEKRKVKLELGLEHRVFEVEVDKVS